MTGDDKRPTEPPQFAWTESTHAAIKAAQEFSEPLLNDHAEPINLDEIEKRLIEEVERLRAEVDVLQESLRIASNTLAYMCGGFTMNNVMRT